MSIELAKRSKAEEIVASLRDANYKDDFQPTYSDEQDLIDSIGHIEKNVDPVTTPDNIKKLSRALANIATGNDARLLLITGNCSERITDPHHAVAATQESLSGLELIDDSDLGNNVLHVRRDRGQNTKPRSASHEQIEGKLVSSYMGDAINSPNPHDRSPDPSRLINGAQQAAALERNLILHRGEHVPAAHEALSLHYENAFVHRNHDGSFLLSADLPWIGVRTNQLHSRHVDLMSTIENPVGVKIDASSDHEHIEGLSKKLNPTRRLGKIAWMLRVGLDHPDAIKSILSSIVDIDQAPIIMYDIHGSTVKRPDGAKIRAVSRILEEIEQLHDICQQTGTKLHGLHLETTSKDRIECVDTLKETPLHEGGIDPQLNPAQTLKIVNQFAHMNRLS